jgi:hypothetical protein
MAHLKNRPTPCEVYIPRGGRYKISFQLDCQVYTYSNVAMKLKTELVIKAAIEAQAPTAWSRKNFEAHLKQQREAWGAPQSLTISGLIEFLIDNEIVRPVEIRSKAYDPKCRTSWGGHPLSSLPCPSSRTPVSHASALEVHVFCPLSMAAFNPITEAIESGQD